MYDWENDGTLPLSEAWPAWDASQLASAEARSKQVDVFGEEGAQSEYKMPQETARGGGLQGLDYPGVIALQGDAAAYTMGGMGLLRAEPFLKQGAAFYIINRQQVPCPRHLHADGWSSKHGPLWFNHSSLSLLHHRSLCCASPMLPETPHPYSHHYTQITPFSLLSKNVAMCFS